MNLRIYQTEDGISSYPLHAHNQYEIIYYLRGCGNLKTEARDFPFEPGTVIIVPPGIYHGSHSDSVFKNISVSGDFESLIKLKEVAVIGNAGEEGDFFARRIYSDRYENNEYLYSLCNTYVLYLIRFLSERNTTMELCVNRIISDISHNAFSADFCISKQLYKSGYAEDYIRQQFKIHTGKTPTEFLNEIRIKRACYLIGVYGNGYSFGEISQKSGYSDYSYFLKCFKKQIGMPPKKYLEFIDKTKQQKG